MPLLTFRILKTGIDFDVSPEFVGPSIHIKAQADDDVQVATYSGELLHKTPWQFVLESSAESGDSESQPEEPIGKVKQVTTQVISGRVELPKSVFTGLVSALIAGAPFEALSVEVTSPDGDDDDRLIWDSPAEDALDIVSISVSITGTSPALRPKEGLQNPGLIRLA